jgi:hypothetical protein
MACDQNKPNITAAIFWLKYRGGWQESGSGKLGKKEEQLERATKASTGRFSQCPPPKVIPIK